MSSIDRVRYSEMSFARLLFRYLWPFWLFEDATRGDRSARAAAYRHNRSMRVYLPGYVMKWLLGSMCAYAVTAAFDALALASSASDGASYVFTILAAGAGILFASSLCVLLLMGYVYLYLGKHDT